MMVVMLRWVDLFGSYGDDVEYVECRVIWFSGSINSCGTHSVVCTTYLRTYNMRYIY